MQTQRPSEVQKRVRPHYKPEHIAFMRKCIAEGKTNQETASLMRKEFPARFGNASDSLWNTVAKYRRNPKKGKRRYRKNHIVAVVEKVPAKPCVKVNDILTSAVVLAIKKGHIELARKISDLIAE